VSTHLPISRPAPCTAARIPTPPPPPPTQLLDVCTSGDEHVVVSYSRKRFLQTGDGHFSPVGGFHKEKDLALILVRRGSCSAPGPCRVLPTTPPSPPHLPVQPKPARGRLRCSAPPCLQALSATRHNTSGRGWDVHAGHCALQVRTPLGAGDGAVPRHGALRPIHRPAAGLPAAVSQPTTGQVSSWATEHSPLQGHASCTSRAQPAAR